MNNNYYDVTQNVSPARFDYARIACKVMLTGTFIYRFLRLKVIVLHKFIYKILTRY